MVPKDAGDAELMQKFRARDADALALLYDRYGHLVYSVLVRITKDRSIAEDLVQELFIRVWNRAKAFDPQKGN